MRTKQRLNGMGFIFLSEKKVQDRNGEIFYPRKAKTPLKAIRQFCFECFGLDRRKRNPPKPIDDVKNCSDPLCPLFDFRLGRNPFIKRTLSEEQRAAAVKRPKIANQ